MPSFQCFQIHFGFIYTIIALQTFRKKYSIIIWVEGVGDLEIRKARLSDLDEITALEALCFPQAEAAARESFLQRLQTFPDSFFVAETEKGIIGFVNGCVTDDKVISDEMFASASCHNPSGSYQAIFGLDVHPDFRRQGIAAELMDHMISTARNAGRKGLILTCKEGLISYYESFGYVNAGVSKSNHGGAKWYDMILIL
jgi:ribosomal protein S18 acetylase RimI-like enzyme